MKKNVLKKVKKKNKPPQDEIQFLNTERSGIKDFIRTGLFSLSFVLLMAGAIYVLQDNVTLTSSPNGKELPIYCVDRSDNKVGLSFDAAWAESCLMELSFYNITKEYTCTFLFSQSIQDM